MCTCSVHYVQCQFRIRRPDSQCNSCYEWLMIIICIKTLIKTDIIAVFGKMKTLYGLTIIVQPFEPLRNIPLVGVPEFESRRKLVLLSVCQLSFAYYPSTRLTKNSIFPRLDAHLRIVAPLQ